MSSGAERLEHPAFVPATGRPIDAAACTDRAKLGVLLQGAAVLSLCDGGGWSLVRGWESAAVDGCGRLSGLEARPGRDSRPAQEKLRELLLRLFRAKTRVAGRGEGRSAARELLTAWEGALAPMSSDEAVGRILAAAEFLWEPEFTFVHQALRGGVVREGVVHSRVAGPAAVRQRLFRRWRRHTNTTICRCLTISLSQTENSNITALIYPLQKTMSSPHLAILQKQYPG